MGLQFQFPEYGWLILLLLPLAGLWFWRERKKAAMIKRLADSPRLLDTLLAGYNPSRPRIIFLTFSFAFAGLIAAIMNPRVVQEKAGSPMEGSQVMFAIDVSNSMLAADVAPNRLERARTFAIRLAEALASNKLGVLAFAGEARLQMPPTADLGAVKQAIQTLSPQSIPLQGTNIESAFDVSVTSLEADALAYSAIVLITDGEEWEGGAFRKAKELGKKGLPVFVAGMGTVKGALLRDPESDQPLLDEEENQVLSKARPDLLQDLAERTGGSYLTVTGINEAVSQLASDLNDIGQRPMTNSTLVNYYSFTPWILLVVIILLVREWLPFLWFKPRVNRGKAVMMLVLAGFLYPAVALRAQKANETLERAAEALATGQYENALLQYEKALELEPSSTEAFFYKALTLYKSGKFDEAARLFNELAAKKPALEIMAAAFNNAGLALANANKLPEAITAFKQALKAAPNDAEIGKNLQQAILELKRQQQEKDKEDKKPEPPMEKEDADRKLQSLMDEEKRTREKMKPRPVGSSGKNW